MYRPLPDGLTIKNSPIEGLGLFATQNIKANSFAVSRQFKGTKIEPIFEQANWSSKKILWFFDKIATRSLCPMPMFCRKLAILQDDKFNSLYDIFLLRE